MKEFLFKEFNGFCAKEKDSFSTSITEWADEVIKDNQKDGYSFESFSHSMTNDDNCIYYSAILIMSR